MFKRRFLLDSQNEGACMIFRDPAIAMWLFVKVGRPISADSMRRSFGLRCFVYALNFFITWGLFVTIVWTLLDPNKFGISIVCAVLGSLVYGVLVAAVQPRIIKGPDDQI
ncbi:hypothetical protein [Xanthomonas theicola]|uniref:hypothetical protein n=1 Tax=Xanthomonas theicola TaxID=56464 RepID=UPI000FF88825|nr:hypothetical protein [Xanthomonas theicola]QNH23965.1 hypothetical protein G4Q83_03215 [Xanthomonas theicola]